MERQRSKKVNKIRSLKNTHQIKMRIFFATYL
jgi:hypothetical protein